MSYPRIGAAHIRSLRRGFLPPATDTYTDGVDWIAVERAVDGDLPAEPLSNDELREAALALVRNGASRKGISIQLSVYERRVKEWEAEAGLLGPDDLCTRDDCPRARAARGLCAIHHQAVRFQEKQWQIALAELATAA